MSPPAPQFIEDVALCLSGMGFSRMPGRVFALLLVSEEASLTAREMAERLDVSAAAISGALRFLEPIRLVQRSRAPGERVDRFGLDETIWGPVMELEVATYTPLIELCERALKEEDLPEAGRRRVTETRDFLAFMLEELPRMWERFRAGR